MKNISVFWPFLAFLSFCHCCSNLKNGFFSNEDGNCLPCQEENVAYFGNNIKGYSPIPQKKSLAQCQIECYNFEDCQFWSYEIPSQQCYLKTKQNKPTKGVNFISGIKNCSNLVKTSLVNPSLVNTRNSELPGQIYVILNQNQKLSVLPADFGQRIQTNTEFHTTLVPDDVEFSVNNLTTFCHMDQLPVGGGNDEKSRQIAFAKRGDCEFAVKAINAQAAGYKALIILDMKNEKTNFSRIVSSTANTIPSAFIRIPIVLLLKKEADIVIKTLQDSSKTNNIVIKRLTSTAKNKPQMAPPVEKPQPSDIPTVFQKGGIFHWFPYQDFLDFTSKWSPLSLILMGGAALIGLIFIVAFQVCICSRCFKKRRNSRVLPESCTEIPYMTAQLPNAVPYDMAITGSVSNLNSSRLYSGGTIPRGANSQLCGQYNEPVEVSCPVCFEVPLPPRKIFQCSQGHTLCDLCLSKIDKKCPTCREDWGNSSNLPVRNRMAESMLYNYFGNNQRPEPEMPSSNDVSFDGGENLRNNSVNVDPYAPSAPPCQPSTSYNVSEY